MTYADVVSQMQAIQTQLAQLGMLKPSTASSGASAATFATALDGATSTSATTSTSGTASTDGTLVSPNGATGADVVDAALEYQGVPYVLGGESKSGIDCSGLVQAAFGKLGVTVPRTVHEQKVLGERVDSLKDAKPGDLIVLNGGDHIALYMGNDTVIHAPYPGRTVSVQKTWFTDEDITTIRRIVPATGDAGSTASAASTVASPTATASLPGTSAATPSGLSPSAAVKASTMLTTYGADVGLYGGSSGSSDPSDPSGTPLSSLLASFGLTGTSGTPGASSSSSTSAQQIIAARAALLGAPA